MKPGRQLLIHFSVLERNFKELKKICPHNEILFMVKADAYGHGFKGIVDFSFHQLGLREFGLATVEEALALRESLPDKNLTLYIFSDFHYHLKNRLNLFIQKNLFPVISHWRDLQFILDETRGKNFPLCLKFDTGMNRLGLPYQEAEKVVQALLKAKHPWVYHLMTHLACSSLPMESHGETLRQLERFKAIKSCFEEAGVEIQRSSSANSGAIEQSRGLEETHVRPGLMLYGPSALDTMAKGSVSWKGEIISELKTSIIKTQSVKKGTPVGYGAIPLPREGELAIIALGYGDGLANTFRGVHLKHRGVEGEVVGKVNMDMAQVLFPPGTPLIEGEDFTVWDSDPGYFRRLSDESGHIPYELFCQLTTRVPRKYLLK